MCFMPGVKGVSSEITLKPTAEPSAVKERSRRLLCERRDRRGDGEVAADGGAVTLFGSVR